MLSKLSLNTTIEKVLFIGPSYSRRLKKLNIFIAEDLLHHYPSRYQDFSLLSPIAKVQAGETVTVQGEIISCQNLFTKFGKKIQKAVVKDDSGTIEVIWFNQTFIPQTLKSGLKVSLAGEVKFFGRKLILQSPEYELISPPPRCIHTGRLVPVYPETAGISSKWLRSRIKFLLDQLQFAPRDDWLPGNIKTKHRLINLETALQQIHFPQNQKEAELARSRLSFDEMFLLQLEALIRKQQWQKQKLSHRLTIDQDKVLNLIARLPFQLTASQNRCLKEILTDLNLDKPMNRLLQGEVGSGKTVVAAIAMYISFLNGYQSVLMAPTEILAQQHFNTLRTVLSGTGAKIGLVTSSTKNLKLEGDVFVGTHALLFRRLEASRLGLVVIDEQHRFGVKQRSQLSSPHLLTMTATPIPRTVALTVYADLDLSILDQMPAGRKKIKTWVVSTNKRLDAYHWIEKEIKHRHAQVFVVCPLIEPSDKETMQDIKAVTHEFNQLKSVFSDLKLALIHGRMKAKEKEIVITDFREKKTHILVATPVIEVGIDIPGATIMVIENADRFGLAQLHQLRGRVGRSDQESYCLIFTNNARVWSRLKNLETIESGLKLAELDLKLRGPGDLYGFKQHGFFNLKLASLTDAQLIKTTQAAAGEVVNRLTPSLKAKLKQRKMTPVAPN